MSLRTRSWLDQTGLAALIAGAAAVVWINRGQPIWLQAISWTVLVVVLGALSAGGIVRLFGPVLFYDLVRIARRGRYVWLRLGYALILLLLLTSLYIWWSWNLPRGQRLSAQEITRFAEWFFLTFMAAEFVVAFLLTPAYTAGAIAEEKDRRTLELLLATDLDNREIVLSKLLSRLANLTLILITGVPILSLTQFFGGVDPNLVLTGFAALGMTVASLASLSTLFSVHARKPREAIVMTYLTAAAYLGGSYLLVEWVAAVPNPQVWSWRLGDWSGAVNAEQLVDALASGNLLVALRKLWEGWDKGRPLTAVLPEVLRRYALFHGIAALGCTAWSIVRLRALALKHAGAPPKPRKGRWGARNPLGDDPMLWREIYVERGLRLNLASRLVLLLLVLVSLAPAIQILGEFFGELAEGRSRATWAKELGLAMMPWVQTVGTLVACLTLLAVAVRAAVSISGERDKQTLDSLLLTPLRRDEILFSKWLGSILSARWGWLWLSLIWGIGVASGGMHYLALPLVIVAWVVFAVFVANLGLYFSSTSRSNLRAILSTFFALLAVCFGHWLIWSCGLPFFIYSSGNRSEFPGWVTNFQVYGLTPPMVLRILSFQGNELQQPVYENFRTMSPPWERFFCAMVGVVCWGLFALVLGRLASARFRREAGGEPVHASEFAVGATPLRPDLFPDEPEPTVPMAEPVEESKFT